MNAPDRERQLAFLEATCTAQLDEDGLDELVHDLKGKEDAAINNGGVSAQLEYILESLGAVEAARAVIGADVELPDYFQTGVATPPERSWRVSYRVCATDGEAFHSGTVSVLAQNEAEAGKKAVLWAHDNDPFCDERIDYHVELVGIEQTGEGDDDEQDDPAG